MRVIANVRVLFSRCGKEHLRRRMRTATLLSHLLGYSVILDYSTIDLIELGGINGDRFSLQLGKLVP